jgi:AcrR family transcriptional regulator
MRQEERRAATRSAIVDAAEILFAARGVDGVTIDDIVARAAIARGSFYYNFQSKEQVVLAIGQRDLGRLARRLDKKLVRGSSPSEVLRELLASTCRWYAKHRHLVKTLLMSSLEQARPAVDSADAPSFRKLAERIVQRGQERGELRTDFEAAALAEIVVGMFLQAAMFWIYASKPGRLDRWVDRSLTVFLEGARSQETNQ